MKIRLRFISGILALTFGFVACTVQAQQEIPTTEQQIQAAVSAAPESMRKEAKVLGYDREYQLVSLREGTNELICLADDPQKSGFHVACYFKELEPFMKRGRELRSQGKSRSEADKVLQFEIEAGKLEFPDKPMALYSLTGPDEGFDYSKGVVSEATPLRVVYVPYATVQSTGISATPAGPRGPWLMEPGQPWAHIMIPGQPVKVEKKAVD